MTRTRIFLWLATALAAPVVLATLWIALFGWNWLRGPIEQMTAQRTGRVLAINGDLSLHLGWPWPRVQADSVAFANPPWAQEKQMVSADAVEISVDLPRLLQGDLVFPTVKLLKPVVYLEQNAQGQKNWLLDASQQDENARARIGQLTLDQGMLGYDAPASKTHIRAELSTTAAPPGGTAAAAEPGVSFRASGHYRGLPLVAVGTGGPILALRDESTPYALTVDTTVGRTRAKAAGTVTGLSTHSAVDMRLALSGDSLEQLYPLLGIPAPPTHAYAVQGQLVHSGASWRYQAFTGRIGNSDMAGTAQVVTGGKRPALSAELSSKLLDLGDLAPVIGVRPTTGALAAEPASAPAGVLPDVPFKMDSWTSMDADVRWQAKQIRRAKALPWDALTVHLTLRDAVLTLAPLDFGVAGGNLHAQLTLDGRAKPIQASAQVQVRKVQLSQLFPSVVLNQASIGQINGAFALSGRGNSIADMLSTGNGQVAIGIARGEVSQLMMEKAGLHLWEILQLNMVGDKRVTLRCALADFEVKHGVMQVDTLVFDTDVTTLLGSGRIDLAHETLDLTLTQKTKYTSPLALRSPIYIRGTFAKPTVGVDKGRVALRAAGAVALGLLNPFLALIPLVDPGPGEDSDCARLVLTATNLRP